MGVVGIVKLGCQCQLVGVCVMVVWCGYGCMVDVDYQIGGVDLCVVVGLGQCVGIVDQCYLFICKIVQKCGLSD